MRIPSFFAERGHAYRIGVFPFIALNFFLFSKSHGIPSLESLGPRTLLKRCRLHKTKKHTRLRSWGPLTLLPHLHCFLVRSRTGRAEIAYAHRYERESEREGEGEWEGERGREGGGGKGAGKHRRTLRGKAKSRKPLLACFRQFAEHDAHSGSGSAAAAAGQVRCGGRWGTRACVGDYSKPPTCRALGPAATILPTKSSTYKMAEKSRRFPSVDAVQKLKTPTPKGTNGQLFPLRFRWYQTWLPPTLLPSEWDPFISTYRKRP